MQALLLESHNRKVENVIILFFPNLWSLILDKKHKNNMLTESRQGLILKFHSLRYLTGRLFEHFTIVTFKSCAGKLVDMQTMSDFVC